MRNIQSFIVNFLLLVIGLSGGYYVGVRGYEVNLSTNIREVTVLNKEKELPSSVDFAKFWVVWDMVNQSHIKKPLNPQDLLDGAVAGMVQAIGDPYTAYLNTERNKDVKADLNGEYDGIGAQLGFDENQVLIIVSPLDGSPAQAIGIRPGDKILQIDGTDTQGISIEEAVNKIRGPAGTVVSLMMHREGMSEPFTFNITRAQITIESVRWEDKGDGIAYIRLSRFGENTNSEWEKSIGEIKYQMPNLKGIVLDVRNNPGGYLDSAVFVSSEFVKNGVIVAEKFSDGTNNTLKVNRAGSFTDENVKVIVLVNRGSASASEIVAAALKERRGATVVGERSFGKGSVQKAEEFPDGSSLHVTIAKWLTPDENWIDKANSRFADSVYNEKDERGNEVVGGIKPDVAVEITDEDLAAERDTQLDKAIELLK